MGEGAERLGDLPGLRFSLTSEESLYFLELTNNLVRKEGQPNGLKRPVPQFKDCIEGAQLSIGLKQDDLDFKGHPSVDFYCLKSGSKQEEPSFVPHLNVPLLLVDDSTQLQLLLSGGPASPETQTQLNVQRLERVIELHHQLAGVGSPERLRQPFEILIDQLSRPDWDSSEAEARIVALATTLYETLKVYAHNNGFDFIPFPQRSEDVWDLLKEHFRTVAANLRFHREQYPQMWAKLSVDVRASESYFKSMAELFEKPYAETVEKMKNGTLSQGQGHLLSDYLSTLALLRIGEEKWKTVNNILEELATENPSQEKIDRMIEAMCRELAGLNFDKEYQLGANPYQTKAGKGSKEKERVQKEFKRRAGERIFIPEEINGQPVQDRLASLLTKFVAARRHFYGHDLEVECVMAKGPLEGLTSEQIADLRHLIEERYKLGTGKKGSQVLSLLFDYNNQAKGCRGDSAKAVDALLGLGTRKADAVLKRTPGFEALVDAIKGGQRHFVLKAPPEDFGNYLARLSTLRAVKRASGDKKGLAEDMDLLEHSQRWPTSAARRQKRESELFVATKVASVLFVDDDSRRQLAEDIYWERVFKQLLKTLNERGPATKKDASLDQVFLSMVEQMEQQLLLKTPLYRLKVLFVFYLYHWMKEAELARNSGEDLSQAPRNFSEVANNIISIVDGFIKKIGVSSGVTWDVILKFAPDVPDVEDLAMFEGLTADQYLSRSVQQTLQIDDAVWTPLWSKLKTLGRLETVGQGLDVQGQKALVFKRSVPGNEKAAEQLTALLSDSGPAGERIKQALIDGASSPDPLSLFFVAAGEDVRDILRHKMTEKEIRESAAALAQIEIAKAKEEFEALAARPFMQEHFEGLMWGGAALNLLVAGAAATKVGRDLSLGLEVKPLDLAVAGGSLAFAIGSALVAELVTDQNGRPGTGNLDLDTAIVGISYGGGVVGLGLDVWKGFEFVQRLMNPPSGMRAFSCTTDGADADGDGKVNLCDRTPYPDSHPTSGGGGDVPE